MAGKPWERFQSQTDDSSPKPWERFQSSPQMDTNPAPSAPETSAAAAGLQGFGQGGTLGYLPQIQAGAGAGMQKIGEMLGGPKADTYEDLKKYFQNKNETLKEQHPIASAAGNIAGAVATLPVGGGEAEGASLLAKAGKAATTGAAYGGLANPEVDSIDPDPYAGLKARLRNAGIGALTGGIAEGTLGNLGAKLEQSGERTTQQAVVKQIGANAGQIKKILQKDEIPKIEGFLTNEGLMSAGKSMHDVADVSGQILQDDGPKIGQLYQDAQDAATVASVGQPNRIDGNQLADQILDKVKSSSKNHPDRNLVNKTMDEALQPLRDMGENANIVDVHQFRKGLDENINWGQKTQDRDAVQRAYIDARNMVADKTKQTINALDNSLGGNKLQELKDLNDRYSAASTVNNIATQGVARETAKAFMGTGILGMGAGGAAATLEYQRTHDPLKAFGAGAATAAAVTLGRKFGNPVGYYGGKALQSAGQGLEAITPNADRMGVSVISPWVNMKKNQEGQ